MNTHKSNERVADVTDQTAMSDPQLTLRAVSEPPRQFDREHDHRPVVAYIDKMPFTRECFATSLGMMLSEVTISAFASVATCRDRLVENQAFALVLYNIGSWPTSNKCMDQDLSALCRSFANTPVVIISDSDHPDSVLRALACGVRGYIPMTMSVELTIEAMRVVLSGGVFLPPATSAHWYSGSTQPMLRNVEQLLTARELAVFNRLQRGTPTKVVAVELNISESTVKVHIHNIKRKLGATNLTQVALLTRVKTSLSHSSAQEH